MIHTILICSSYVQGKRIALHLIDVETKEVKKIIKRIETRCAGVPFSTHIISTSDESWESVVASDFFFEDIEVFTEYTDFIKIIKDDLLLTGLDVAKYILSKSRGCTHLKLQKLTYLCFAEYLEKTGKTLFRDKIYAFKLGPVVETVYDEFKDHGEIVMLDEDDTDPVSRRSKSPDLSRILYSIDGDVKIEIIDSTIEKYGDMEASELVNLTHREGSPWHHSFTGGYFTPIACETIVEYHYIEKVRL